MSAINEQHKDRLFRMIFGREENKQWTLSLYNAINGSNYTNPDDISLNTIDDVMYLGMKNDISFIIAETMNLYEQQSSYNPNMPLMQLIYTSKLYAKYLELNHINYYSSSLKKIPMPVLICFYNGTRDVEDRKILKLSDSFSEELKDRSDIEVRVTMININYGRNKELMDACQVLKEYSIIVDTIRTYSREIGMEPAIEKSIRSLPDESQLKPYLLGHMAEVKTMCLREYSEDEIKEMFRRDGYEDGVLDGKLEGKLEGIRKLMEKKGFSAEEAMDIFDISEKERPTIAKMI